jgi:manganese/zinc/iron transport system permease protein
MYAELIAIMLMTTIACVVPGVFLVIRGMALMSDALSHALLPGIVIMFLLNRQCTSFTLIIGALCAGLATVLLTEAIMHTRQFKKDTAIGLVFPLFFSIGVILINLYARTIHLDMDMVILGHLVFAPFKRFIMCGNDWGSQALWMMSAIACINGIGTYVTYKELLLSSFDDTLAYTSGFRPRMLHYCLMIMTSITCVCAFDVVGALVVVALMLVPAATAYLCSSNVVAMVWYALFFGVSAVWGGCLLAYTMDVSAAGSLATASGAIFMVVFMIHYVHLDRRHDVRH